MTDASSQDFRAHLFAIADEQAGYFTAQQAQAAGYSYASQSYHLKQGHWLNEGWGLFRLRDYPTTPDEQLVRLMLWSRDREGKQQAVVSHDTALRVYKLSDVMPSKIHLSVPKGFRKDAPSGVVLYKAALPSEDIQRRDGYRITTPLRTLLDVADSALSPEHLNQAVEEALAQGLVRKTKLQTAINRGSDPVKERFAYAGAV